MKKILISILIWVVISTVFVSCNQDEMSNVPDNINQTDNTPSPIYDKFVYRLEHDKLGINNIGMPLKVNLTTGNTTTACIDPLCMHDSPDCPFYDCMGSMIDGEVIFFQRGQMLRGENGYTGTEKLCTYHIATGQIHVLEEYSDSIIFLKVSDDVLYYYTAVWEKEGNNLVCTYHLHRVDGKTGKITELTLPETYKSTEGYTDGRDYPNIVTIDGETIYWRKNSSDGATLFYTSDLNAGNWTKLDDGVSFTANVYHNGYGYSIGKDIEMIDPEIGMKSDNFIYKYYLVKSKIGSKIGEGERIAENIGSSNFIVTDRYIFTMESLADAPDDLTFKKNQYSSGQTVVMGSSSAAAEIMNGCRIWRMNHDGSERVMIAETDAYYFVLEGQFRHDDIMFGYYEDEENTYLAFFFMEKNDKGELSLSKNTLVLDTASGEFLTGDYIS